MFGNSVLFSLAFGVAFVATLLWGRFLIPRLAKWQRKGQPVRTDGPVAHLEKKGTPTMGGLIFIPAIIVASLIFMDWSNLVAWIPLMALVGFGVIGFIDDYNKIIRGNAYAGLSEWGRLLAEGVIAVALAFLVDLTMPAYIPDLSVFLPFGIIIPIGILYFVWAYFVVVGTANAANLTDGLDGMLSKVYLCPMAVMVVALVGVTRTGFMPSLVFLPEAAALFPVLGAVLGAVLAFLWFNSKPAAVFMGDVGSLALGGLLGIVALILKSEVVLAVAAMMMILILLSSFLQIFYYKFVAPRGRPPFLMAPLHHHFEMKGWAETKITDRFFILSVIFSGVAVGVLKL
ncbi:MAG: phospho-N-acetylmuramoyl-pentapeptide-transferase [Rickettsiales bacterium]|jgi:phospho-N-acetylmuramoyl-pentapeptide-transferase|nr:phospho-N-acetylmuramoyl-pentapeptide-transferase [Rickettsiales bacterium]